MKKLYLYEKKEQKIVSEEKIEIDSEDLELFSFSHVKDYLKIPSKTINDKTVLEWFSINNISYWWFVSPIIHPKYKEAVIFIEKFFSIVNFLLIIIFKIVFVEQLFFTTKLSI